MVTKKINILSVFLGVFLSLLFSCTSFYAADSDCFGAISSANTKLEGCISKSKNLKSDNCGDIFDAAKNGDLIALEKLIKLGTFDINAVNKDGKTLLYIASCENNFSIVLYLIKNGAQESINKAVAGWTPLYNACYNNNLEMVKFLIENGAKESINKNKNVWKRTPLYWACRNNNLEMARYLLVNGAEKLIDRETAFFGGTNLYWACYHGNLSMVKCLVSFGADINKVTSYNETLLYWACKNNNVAIFNYLFELWENKLFNLAASVKLVNKYNNESCLYWACYNDNFDMAKTLIDNGAQEIINNVCKDSNKTALYWACYNNNLKLVRYLIENGANIDQESFKESVDNLKIHRYFQDVLNNK